MTDKSFDFSFHKTTPNLSTKHKKFLKKQSGIAIDKLFNIQQVHGRRVIIATKERLRNNKEIIKADGLITDESYVPLVIRTADCVPIFIFDTQKEVAGLLHAGWQSLRKGIISSALTTMRRKWITDYKKIKIIFGPCIRSCCFEVDDKVQKYFPNVIKRRNKKVYVDLVKEAKNQFFSFNVNKKNIFDCRICTCCDKRFFSFRRQGDFSGRMLSLVMLKNKKLLS